MAESTAPPLATFDPPTRLSLILDLSPEQWELSASSFQSESPLAFDEFISQVLAFVNAHLAGKHENTITILGAFPGKSVMLYSSQETSSSPVNRDANVYYPFAVADNAVIDRIMEEFSSISTASTHQIGLVGAITKGLCHLNKVLKSTVTSSSAITSRTQLPDMDARMLIISVSPDLSASYIPIMNSIFAAQKLKVKIDVCKLFGEDNVFLQQAAHLTGGSYVVLKQRDALLQYLVMCFLASSTMSQALLALPTQDRVDLRAACFCHKNIVDIGYVCSVCLSIFCTPMPVCLTCRTKFPMKTLRRLREGISKGGTSGSK